MSLGDSNLVWLNPDEKLSTNKSQYEAKFEETSTKNEKVVTVMVTVCKETPMERTDYTVPTNLKGIVGDKLSTVSLGDSNLIWVNPDEVLTTNKTRYEAKFEATDTKGELVINVTVTVSKKTPIKGTDYSVPTNLRGTAGSKLSTVSLGNSHLVWVKPNETLSIQKTEYEAKFVETDTMKEVTVMVKVTVQRAPSDDDDHGGGGGGGTTNPPVNPVDPDNPTVNPDNPTVNPDNPTVNPDNPTVNPDNPTVNPDNPTVNPDGPTVNPDGPTVNPDGPTVNPDGPTVNPDGPTVNPDGPTVNPDGPTVNPDGPTVNPDGPTVNPDGPTVNPDGPTVKPDGPTVNPDAPTVSDGPMVNPDGPMVNPDVPAVNLDALLVIPEVPKIEIQE
ncbi:MAG: hypothetical protein HFJ31_03155 [Clostridia bacterium]|nr:hypothetical protein [Clostridia bacterium]